MNPSTKIKFYRRQKSISQNGLAKRLGISQGYLSSLEKGNKSPTIRMLYRIADELDICPKLMLNCTINCEECKKSIKCTF